MRLDSLMETHGGGWGGSGALRCSFSLDPICFHQLPHPSTLEWDALPPQPCTDPLDPRDSGSAPLLYAPRLWKAGGTLPHKQRCPDVLQAQWAVCATWLSIVHPTPTSVSIKPPSQVLVTGPSGRFPSTSPMWFPKTWF